MPVGLDLGVVYELVGPTGVSAVFNDDTDTDFVGYLRNITGLDSPDVRDNGDNLTEGDGGVHGDFYYGRRSFVLEGMIWPDPDATTRNARIDKLRQASDAMRADCTLMWPPSGGAPVQITGRRQQPLRITNDGRIKAFQIALIAADPRIYSQVLHSGGVVVGATTPGGFSSPLASLLASSAAMAGQVTISNAGTAPAPALLTVQGPVTNPRIYNATVGKRIALTYTLTATETLVIDTAARTVLLNGTASRYSAIDFANTDWWDLNPGSNDIRLEAAAVSSGALLTVQWRDATL